MTLVLLQIGDILNQLILDISTFVLVTSCKTCRDIYLLLVVVIGSSEYHLQNRRRNPDDRSKRQGRGLWRLKRNWKVRNSRPEWRKRKGIIDEREKDSSECFSCSEWTVIAPCTSFYMTDPEWFNEYKQPGPSHLWLEGAKLRFLSPADRTNVRFLGCIITNRVMAWADHWGQVDKYVPYCVNPFCPRDAAAS